MKSRTTPKFRELLRALPESVRDDAIKAYRQWLVDPAHPSLHFKQVKPTRPPVYSARINLNYRAIGILKEGGVTWVWIGNHDEYERLLR